MELLIAYILAISIIVLWFYGIIPSIRNIFKKYMLQKLRIILKTSHNNSKKELIAIYKISIKIISGLNYKEFIALTPLIKDINAIKTYKAKKCSISSKESEFFLNECALAIIACLYACTFIGSIKFLWFINKNFCMNLVSRMCSVGRDLQLCHAIPLIVVVSLFTSTVPYDKKHFTPTDIFSTGAAVVE